MQNEDGTPLDFDAELNDFHPDNNEAEIIGKE